MTAPALTAVHEVLMKDVRLMQLTLQAQADIIRKRGLDGACIAQNSKLLVALTSSSVLQVQHQQKARVAAEQQASAGNASAKAVLAVLLQQWGQLLQERLHAAESFFPDIPLVSAARTEEALNNRPGAEAAEDTAWQQIGHSQSPFVNQLEPSAGCIKLMYAAEDLLEAVLRPVQATSHSGGASISRQCSNSQDSVPQQEQQEHARPHLTLIQSVHAPNRMWLQSFFADLQPDKRQVGLDDVLHPWYKDQQLQQARNTASSCSAAAARAAARSGVPASERPWLWATALGLSACPPYTQPSLAALSNAGASQDAWWHLASPRAHEQLQLLCEAVKQQGLLMDVLTCADVQQMADDAHFFVFEEAMRALLLAFSRDASVLNTAVTAAMPARPLLAPEQLAQGAELPQPYPPSGVLPFQGLCAYLAPLCYLYSSPVAIYPVWHAMYCQYWCLLHTLNISCAPMAGLPVLCRTFLDLLQEVDLDVHHHLCQLTASPLEFVFPWLLTAFAAHLAPAETLLLWDRVIGFDSLLPLPVLAVAVLTFRRDLVLAAETSEELVELLQDLTQLRVVPLLQALLFDT